MGTFYFKFLPDVHVMTTIREHCETMSSFSSSPSPYQRSPSEVSLDPELPLDLSEPDISNVSEDIKQYIEDLKENISNMKTQISIQNKYIHELTLKYESSLDTVVELNDNIRLLEKEIREWRIKARSHELSSSMLEHDVNELKDTIVLLRRESIDFNKANTDIHRNNDVEHSSQGYFGPARPKHQREVTHTKPDVSLIPGEQKHTKSKGGHKKRTMKQGKGNIRAASKDVGKPLRPYGANFLSPEDIETYKIKQRPIDGAAMLGSIPVGIALPLQGNKILPILPQRPTMPRPSQSFPGRFVDRTPRVSSVVGERKFNYKTSTFTTSSANVSFVKSLSPEQKPQTPFKNLLKRRPTT